MLLQTLIGVSYGSSFFPFASQRERDRKKKNNSGNRTHFQSLRSAINLKKKVFFFACHDKLVVHQGPGRPIAAPVTNHGVSVTILRGTSSTILHRQAQAHRRMQGRFQESKRQFGYCYFTIRAIDGWSFPALRSPIAAFSFLGHVSPG